jgi:hypothetical protein
VTSTGPRETLSITKDWLKHCVERHGRHKSLFVPHNENIRGGDFSDVADEMSTIQPTRLLDLEAFKHDCPDLRLIEGAPSGSAYVTLSHCWGATANTRYQTTASTLRDHLERIRYADLPKTFHDAIIVYLFLRFDIFGSTVCVLYRTANKSGLAKRPAWHMYTATLTSTFQLTGAPMRMMAALKSSMYHKT